MAGDLPEVDLVGLVLRELAGPGEHRLDGAAGERVLALDGELVAVAADELDVHGVRPLAAPAHLLPRVHAAVHALAMSVCNRQCGPSNKEEQALLVTKESTNFHYIKYTETFLI